MSKRQYYLCDRCHEAMDAPCKMWTFADGYAYEGKAFTKETRVELELCYGCLTALIDVGERRHSGGQLLESVPQPRPLRRVV